MSQREKSRTGFIELPPRSELSEAELSEIYVDAARAGTLEPGERIGSYRVLGLIGAGGTGEVYAAERIARDKERRIVALKVATRGVRRADELLAHEANLLARVRTKHVVRVYEYGTCQHARRGYMAMELMKGEELFARRRRQKIFEMRYLTGLAVHILKGLESLHAAGVVHRDLKPENVFLSRRGKRKRATLIDFGIAYRPSEGWDPLDGLGDQLLGTAAYIAPEQWRSHKVDARADLYALGVLLYECAVGDPPFVRETPYATMLAHQNDPIPPIPSTLDAEFCQILYKALAKEVDLRWDSALSMRRAIITWAEGMRWDDDLLGATGAFERVGRPSSDDSAHYVRSELPSSPPPDRSTPLRGAPTLLPEAAPIAAAPAEPDARFAALAPNKEERARGAGRAGVIATVIALALLAAALAFALLSGD